MVYCYDRKWLTQKRLWITVFSVCSVLAVLLALRITVFRGFVLNEPIVPHPATGLPMYTKEFAINHPLTILSMVKDTTITVGTWYIDTMMGKSLGWLSHDIPSAFILALEILLLFSSFKRDNDKYDIPHTLRTVMLLMFIVSYCLILVGMTITWTPTEYHIIEGVQGRYFLPVLLPLQLSFRSDTVKISHKVDRNVIAVFNMFLSVSIQFLLLHMM